MIVTRSRWLGLGVVCLAIALSGRRVHGSIINAASCSQHDIAVAIGTAVSGDVVLVPPCQITWSTFTEGGGFPIAFYAAGNITLMGSGIGQTVIDATPLSASGERTSFEIREMTGVGGLRVTGLTLICGQIRTSGIHWRIDHNQFVCHQHDYTRWGTAIYNKNTNMVGGNEKTADLNGVIDHNSFIDQRTTVYQYEEQTIAGADGSTLWSKALDLGGPNAVYVEDNTFVFESFNDVIDCETGGMYVFRYNTVTDAYFEAHGARFGARSCRKWEIYNNTLISTNTLPGNTGFTFLIKGGTGVMFGNRFTGVWGNGGNGSISLTRAIESGGAGTFLYCDGTSPWDGNLDATGWPCLDQVGRGGDNTGPFDGTPPPYTPIPQSSVPAYFWNNTVNGTQMGITFFDAPTAARYMLNRDYFVSPATAKPGYTPYAHPHPLILAGAPGAATNPVIQTQQP